MHVDLRDSESFDQLLRRFTKGIERSGVIREHRRGLRFISTQEENRAKRRKAERVLSAGKTAKDNLDALVTVVVLVPSSGACRLRSKCRKTVAFGIELAGFRLRRLRVKQVPVFGHH